MFKLLRWNPRLETKVFLSTAIIYLFLSLVTIFVLRMTMLERFEGLQRQAVETGVVRVEAYFNQAGRTMAFLNRDYSAWDQALGYIRGTDKKSTYISDNLVVENLPHIHVDMVVLLDLKGNIRHSACVGNAEILKDALEAWAVEAVRKHEGLIGAVTPAAPGYGIGILEGKALLISASPISDNEGTLDPEGWLIFASVLDGEFISLLQDQLRIDVGHPAMTEGREQVVPPGFVIADASPLEAVQRSGTEDRGKIETLLVYSNAIGPGFVAVPVLLPETILSAGRETIGYAEAALVLILAVGAFASYWLVCLLVVRPLEELEGNVANLGQDGRTFRRLEGSGESQEVKAVTAAINGMLGRMEQSEGKLRESEERYRVIMEEGPEGIFTVEEGTWNLVEMNTAMHRLLGYDAKAAALATLKDLAHENPEQLLRDAASSLEKNAEVRAERRLKRADGTAVEAMLSLVPVRFQGKRHLLGVVVDLRERKLMEETLERAKRLENVGQLAGGIAHDFNNLLTVITASADILKHRGEMDHESSEDIDAILKASSAAADLTRKLLLYGRRSPSNIRSCDLNKLVGGLKGMINSVVREDTLVQFQLAPDLPKAQVDESGLEQAIMNLVINARDALEGRGSIYIRTGAVELSQGLTGSLPALAPGKYVWVQVSDTGTGMTDEVRKRLFEPFFTTKPPGRGTGLGLAMVYSVVSQIKGAIDVATAPRWGTTFTLYLPESIAAVSLSEIPLPPPVQKARFKTNREKILLVEDEAMIRKVVSRQLQNRGYEVLMAGDGEEALHLFRQHRTDPPLLLISDLVMPGDFSGFDLAAELVLLQPDLKMIFISGYSPEIFNDQVDSASMFSGKTMRFLPKPFNEAGLMKAVQEVLGVQSVA